LNAYAFNDVRENEITRTEILVSQPSAVGVEIAIYNLKHINKQV
jgi:hypothetical protein